jgi:hypothetical protein
MLKVINTEQCYLCRDNVDRTKLKLWYFEGDMKKPVKLCSKCYNRYLKDQEEFIKNKNFGYNSQSDIPSPFRMLVTSVIQFSIMIPIFSFGYYTVRSQGENYFYFTIGAAIMGFGVIAGIVGAMFITEKVGWLKD